METSQIPLVLLFGPTLFILPMRNGNTTREKEMVVVLTFYPTYEEWKPEMSESGENVAATFYPTYEEWKQRLRAN